MKLTNDELKELRAFKANLDSDNIRYKEIIKKKLLDNRKIIYMLNNKELQKAEAEADEYFGVNILPYYLISPTQTNIQNFICYDVRFNETPRYNEKFKYCQIIFQILCEHSNIIDKDTYIPRHDLLAALIMDEFNWKNYFGTQINCISDESSVVDDDYACRTLVFELVTPNNIVKTGKDKAPRVVTSEVHI